MVERPLAFPGVGFEGDGLRRNMAFRGRYPEGQRRVGSRRVAILPMEHRALGREAFSPRSHTELGARARHKRLFVVQRLDRRRRKVARWNGTRWASVSTNGLARNISLKDVAALAAGNAWAIGDLTRPDGTPIGAIAARYEGSRMPRLEVSRRLAHRRFGTVTWTVLGSAGGESDSSTHPLVTTAG